jgi:threonylcarbamoyladenosine tRNA methylthiotransferase MtaB
MKVDHMMTASVVTLGCKVNQFESEVLMDSLKQQGYRLVPFGEPADITIINTCTVTHRADFQSRQMARRASRSSPGSLLIVTGCGADVDPERMAEIQGVAHVLGNVEKSHLHEILPLIRRGEFPTIRVSDIQKEDRLLGTPLHSFHEHTRAFLKIQDGCDSRCSYCIVPHARGRSRSLAPGRVLEAAGAFKERGYKEVVLTGIHIGAYGRDLVPPVPLEELLGRLDTPEACSRIRLSSVEPLDFSPGLISTFSQSSRVCPHLHIPIQSGDDEILKEMNRGYDRSFITRLVRDLHQSLPDLCIGADVIVGFPGETEDRFEHTRQLIEALPFSYLHVFPFSRRKGTPAFRFPEQVDGKKTKQRAELLRALGKQKRLAFYQRFLGRELDVLVEDRRDKKAGRLKGISRNYIPVFLAADEPAPVQPDWMTREIRVRVEGVSEQGVTGRVLEKKHG